MFRITQVQSTVLYTSPALFLCFKPHWFSRLSKEYTLKRPFSFYTCQPYRRRIMAQHQDRVQRHGEHSRNLSNSSSDGENEFVMPKKLIVCCDGE